MSILKYYDRTLPGEFIALRHLPPAIQTQLQLDLNSYSEEAKQLLSEMMVLSDELNPRTWLQEERSFLVARISLRNILVLLLQDIKNVHSNPALDHPYLNLVAKLFPCLPDTKEIADLKNILERTNFPSPELLYQSVKQIRSWRDSDVNITDISHLEDLEQLPIAILTLADGLDPLTWLQKERGELCAAVVAANCAMELRPSVPLEPNPTIKQWWINQTAVFDRFNLTLNKLIQKEKSFEIEISGYISVEGFGNDPLWVMWNGFNQIIDNFGYRYLTYTTPSFSNGSELGKCHVYKAIQKFYPSLASGVRSLTFTSSPAVLEIDKIEIPALKSIRLGELVHQDFSLNIYIPE